MSRILDRERTYYEAHRDELLREHRGEFVVIKDDHLLGIYPTRREAREAGLRALGNVDMFVREVSEHEPRAFLPIAIVHSQNGS